MILTTDLICYYIVENIAEVLKISHCHTTVLYLSFPNSKLMLYCTAILVVQVGVLIFR